MIYVRKMYFLSTTLPSAKKKGGNRITTKAASRLLFIAKDIWHCYDNMFGK